MGYPLLDPFGVLLGNDGRPLANGTLESYAAGTAEKLPTFADAALTVENDNPLAIDGYGRVSVFVAAGVPYKLILKSASGALIATRDGLLVPAFAAPPEAEVMPAGTIAEFGGNVLPAGWVWADGAAYPRADPIYAALFAAIGTTFGAGNGSTTFNVPNRKGRFALGRADAGTGSVLGQTGGTIDHVHTGPSHTHAIAAHTHTIPSHTHTVSRDGWGGAFVGGGLVAGRLLSGDPAVVNMPQATQDNITGASSAGVTSGVALATDAAGTGNTGAENPPFLVTNVMCKLVLWLTLMTYGGFASGMAGWVF